MNFVTKIFHSFALGDSVRYGLAIFGNTVKVVFKFGQYTQMSEVDSALTGVQQIGGSCNVGEGLSKCKSELFVDDAGGRTRVLVVIVAGESHYDVSTVASSLKTASRVKIIAVGVGASFDQFDLSAMASSSSYILTVGTTGNLPSLTGSLSSLIMDAGGVVVPSREGGICDLAFMVDTSSSIKGEVNFQLVKKFVTKVFHLFSRGGDVRYGLVVFGNKAEVVFGFSQYASMLEIDSAVANLKLVGGNCNAGAALSRCKTSLFVGPNRGIARVLVALLAGKSSDDISAPTASLKTAGVKIISVGMGGLFDQSQLSSMAFSSSHLLKAPSFGGLVGISGSLSTQISQAGGISISTSSVKAGEVTLDLGFLIDGSSAVGNENNFKHILSFVSAVVRAFPLGYYKTRVGVVVCSFEALVIFNFQTYFDTKSIDQALASVQYPGTNWPGIHNVYLGRGLHVTKHYLFDSSWRAQVPRILVVIAAGTSVDDVLTPSMNIRSYGVEMFCVGVGNLYSSWQLHAMASLPHNEHILKSDYAGMGRTADQLVIHVLKGTCRPCYCGYQNYCRNCPGYYQNKARREVSDRSDCHHLDLHHLGHPVHGRQSKKRQLSKLLHDTRRG
ncbi:cochlin-like isoform X2 [Oculina patagonica]